MLKNGFIFFLSSKAEVWQESFRASMTGIKKSLPGPEELLIF